MRRTRKVTPTKLTLDFVTLPALKSVWEVVWELLTSRSWLEKALALFVIPIFGMVGMFLLPYALLYDACVFVARGFVAFGEAMEEPARGSPLVTRPKSSARASIPASPAGVRCAYCHDETLGLTTSTCEGCGTLLHLACSAELGACPTLGCAKARPPRRRA